MKQKCCFPLYLKNLRRRKMCCLKNISANFWNTLHSAIYILELVNAALQINIFWKTFQCHLMIFLPVFFVREMEIEDAHYNPRAIFCLTFDIILSVEDWLKFVTHSAENTEVIFHPVVNFSIFFSNDVWDEEKGLGRKCAGHHSKGRTWHWTGIHTHQGQNLWQNLLKGTFS